MIKPTTPSAYASRADERRRDALTSDAASFELELAAEDRRAPTGMPKRPDERARRERDPSHDAPTMPGVSDPRALDPRRAHDVSDAQRGHPGVGSAPGMIATLAAQALGAQAEDAALAIGTGAATPEGELGETVAADAADAADANDASSEAATATLSARSNQLAAALIAAEAAAEDATTLLDSADDDDGELAAPGDDASPFGKHAPAAATQRVAHTVPVDAARPLADQVADAVARLAAEAADRSEVVRFRSADFSFSAVVRQDGGTTQVRLLSDDPNTRAFLGDRLPEVRHALERVGFASTSLSVASEGDRQQRQRDPHGAPDERPDERVERTDRAERAPLPSAARDPVERGEGGLHLII